MGILKSGLLMLGLSEGTIKILDPSNNYECLNTLKGHSRGIISIIELTNGTIVSASYDKTLRIWD